MVGKVITHKRKWLSSQRGWFRVHGQQGSWTPKERILALKPLQRPAKDATILDLGCAEGAIGLHFLATGPGAVLHGLELHRPFVESAKILARRYPKAEFFAFDLNDFAGPLPPALLPSYDIVLCTCIAHKLRDPESFIRRAAGMCKRYFALHLPAPVICDRRSDYKLVDTTAVMDEEGFKLFYDAQHVPNLSQRIYRRRETMGLHEDTVKRLKEFVSNEIAPDKMSANDAIGILEEIEADIGGMIDALNDQIRAEQERANKS